MYCITRKTQKRSGFTITELIVSLLIGGMAVSFVSMLMLYSAKSEAILFPQTTQQHESLRAIQVSGDLLRNANYSTIDIKSANLIEFESEEMPGSTLQLHFQNGDFIFKKDDETRTIAEQLDNVEFEEGSENGMISIRVMFKYRKFKGYNTEEANKLKGVFETQVFPRNT